MGPQLLALDLAGMPGGAGGGEASGIPSGVGASSNPRRPGSPSGQNLSAPVATLSTDSLDEGPPPVQETSDQHSHVATKPVPEPPVVEPESPPAEDVAPEPVEVAEPAAQEPVPPNPPKQDIVTTKAAEPEPIPRKSDPQVRKPKAKDVQKTVSAKVAPKTSKSVRKTGPSSQQARLTSVAASSAGEFVASGLSSSPDASSRTASAESPPGSGPRLVPAAGQGTGTGAASGSGSSSAGGGGGEGGIGQGSGTGGSGEGLMSFGAPGGPGIERMVMPEYPREARRLGKEGVVVLKLHLDAEGAVESVEVLETPGYGLDEAARQAVLRSRFHPATVGGVPVPCRAILPVNFRLR